jgi:hypothetical protein
MVVAESITTLPVLAADARQRGLGGVSAGAPKKTAAGKMDVLGRLAPTASLTDRVADRK